MRILTLIIICVALTASCGAPAVWPNYAGARPAYAPETFRQSVTALIKTKDYFAATALVRSADVDRQLKYDQSGYLAIGGDKIYLPGVGQSEEYDSKRDWYVSGTSDAIEDPEWQSTATEFADRYNRRRSGNGG